MMTRQNEVSLIAGLSNRNKKNTKQSAQKLFSKIEGESENCVIMRKGLLRDEGKNEPCVEES